MNFYSTKIFVPAVSNLAGILESAHDYFTLQDNKYLIGYSLRGYWTNGAGLKTEADYLRGLIEVVEPRPQTFNVDWEFNNPVGVNYSSNADNVDNNLVYMNPGQFDIAPLTIKKFKTSIECYDAASIGLYLEVNLNLWFQTNEEFYAS